MIVFTILYYLLIGIGIFLAAIIIVPYDYRVTGEKSDESEISVLISWLFGGIKLALRKSTPKKTELMLTIFGFNKQVESNSKPKSPSSLAKKATNPSKGSTTVKKKHKLDVRNYLKKDILHKILSVVLKVLRHCQPRQLSIRGKYGFDDPSYTGLTCAITNQLYCWFDKYDIEIQPVFDEEILEGHFLVGGRIWLPYLIQVMVGLLITKPIRNIIISKLKLRIKGGPQYVR